jgi:hypothetical protein
MRNFKLLYSPSKLASIAMISGSHVFKSSLVAIIALLLLLRLMIFNCVSIYDLINCNLASQLETAGTKNIQTEGLLFAQQHWCRRAPDYTLEACCTIYYTVKECTI